MTDFLQNACSQTFLVQLALRAQTAHQVCCNVIKLRGSILSHQQILDIFVDEIFLFINFYISKRQIDFCLKKEYIKSNK